jgi:hypothetical protein
MSVQKPSSKDAGDITTPWPSASDWWAPAITGCTVTNNKLRQSCLDFSVEWQTFVGRRISEDFHLLQELAAAKAPVQIWSAWSTFWQKAAQEYGTEYSVMAKLAAGFVPSIAPISRGDSGAETPIARPQSRAA